MTGAHKTGLTRRGAAALLGIGVAACGEAPEPPPYDGVVAFAHGVASGDPGENRVVIWTRVTPEQQSPVPVRWVVARNRALTEVVHTGVVETSPARDYTVKVDVVGLRPGAPYFYGFLTGEAQSPVGKTRTLARGSLQAMKIAVASCASYPHGYFNAYQAIADVEDLDLVVHLGDYIYEYGLSGYGGDRAVELGRIPRPQIECVSLEDYRARHAQAKRETELQAAHAVAPWIVVWDDHEVANNSWSGGAENHDKTGREGDWEARKRAALQAYYEWMPIREPEGGAPLSAINRAYTFGDLCTLVMLESRLGARAQQFDYATQMPLVMQAWDFSNPTAPRIVESGDAVAQIRMLPVPFEYVDDVWRPVRDWRRVSAAVDNMRDPPYGMRFMPDIEQLKTALNDPARTMIGATQQTWLADALKQSADEGVAWRLIGNQVLMAPLTAPNFSRLPAAFAQQLEQVLPGAATLLGFTAREIPLNTDSWDGYPVARERVLQSIKDAGDATLVLSGDTHAAWVNELHHDEELTAVEFGTTSITSPSDASYFVNAGVDFASALQARNPHVRWNDQTQHGFLLVTLEKDTALAEFFAVSTIAQKEFTIERAAAFRITRGQGGATELVREA